MKLITYIIITLIWITKSITVRVYQLPYHAVSFENHFSHKDIDLTNE
jgi:hypothetical protein